MEAAGLASGLAWESLEARGALASTALV